MTVRELIEELQKMPLDAEVYKENVQSGYGYTDYDDDIHAVEKVDNYEIRLR